MISSQPRRCKSDVSVINLSTRPILRRSTLDCNCRPFTTFLSGPRLNQPNHIPELGNLFVVAPTATNLYRPSLGGVIWTVVVCKLGTRFLGVIPERTLLMFSVKWYFFGRARGEGLISGQGQSCRELAQELGSFAL